MSESENIDLSKNLCVSEDAFEQFQAVSAYEEDEFITLSDIVDPPQPTLDINACLDEIEDDICIVRESDLQSDEIIVLEKGAQTGQLLNPATITNNENLFQTLDSSSTAGNSKHTASEHQHTPKKRGRKRKNVFPSVGVKEQFNMSSESVGFDNAAQSALMEKGNVDSNYITASDKTVFDRLNQTASKEFEGIKQNSKRRKRQIHNDIPAKAKDKAIITDDTLKSRKRGKPRKASISVVQQGQSLSVQDDCIVLEKTINDTDTPSSSAENFTEGNDINDSPNSDKDLLKVCQNSVTSAVDTEQKLNKKTPRKRGRPKKSTIDNEITNQPDSKKDTSPIEISKQNCLVSSSKGEKKKKSKVEDKKYDEIELELLRMLSTPTEELEERYNKQKNEDMEKLPKKKGRKQKKNTEEIENFCTKSQKNEAKQVVVNKGIDDETDDISLSSLKKQLRPEDDPKEKKIIVVNKEQPLIDKISENADNIREITKRNSKKPVMSDFEYNVDNIVSESIIENVLEENIAEVNNSEIESPSKRPIRRKAKKVLHYDEGSDEDPFANVELSDDDGDLSGRRGGRYYSDDEYIPGKKKKKGKSYSESESSVSECDDLGKNDETVTKKLAKKKGRKSDESPKKSQKQCKKNDRTQNAILDVTSTAADTTTQIDDDLEFSLQSPDITTNENCNQKSSQAWGISNEFENYIAQKIQGTNLKIKKLTGAVSTENAITPLEIPVLDPNEPKKTVEISTQTIKTSTKTVEVQTTSPYESIMKCKVPLTADQSEKACDFLKSIVRNTSELGQLMIQKSEDFIQKKINTKNVTDTNKMDYCVQKSFLLFKLAKHNLVQMEEDLANEYDQFLKSHNMLQFRESPKCIMANYSKQTNSDSDCEIVEEPIQNHEQEKEKSKFNLKTVFLNKELSIKIAKKPTEEPQSKKEKVNLKGGKHTVWINDSILVKKVKPNQSFLAQDSRNKKPPDNHISIEMVQKFFDIYYKRQQVLLTCAPFISPEWLTVKQISVCNYFIAQSHDLSTNSCILLSPQDGSESNIEEVNSVIKEVHVVQPSSLISLCMKVLHKYMYEPRFNYEEPNVVVVNRHLLLKREYQPHTLFRLSFDVVVSRMHINEDDQIFKKVKESQKNISLKKLCLKSINTLIHTPMMINCLSSRLSYNEELPYIVQSIGHVQNYNSNVNDIIDQQIKRNIKSLFSCCVEIIQKDNLFIHKCNNLDINENNITYYKIKELKHIALEKVKHYLYNTFLDVYNERKKSEKIIEKSEQTILPFNENFTENAHKVDRLLVLTIKSVNSLSNDIFAKLPATLDEPVCSEDGDSNFSNFDEYEQSYSEANQYDNLAEESNWDSRVQLQELKSCFMPIHDNLQMPVVQESNNECFLASIKIEPLEETSENIDTPVIKTEVTENDETIFNPLATKIENSESETEGITCEQTSSSYDMDAFEEFARTSKMLHTAVNCDVVSDEIFSQSALRVRKQHEPDMDDEFDTSMSLLVPQQNTELAKDRLMKSSSDDEISTQKNVTKKKRKMRPKTSRLKNKNVTTTKNKNTPENEVAILTRKMQERIRQEQKSNDSSDSELEDSLAKLKHDKSKKELGEIGKHKTNVEVEKQIQCNDVDSTENLVDKLVTCKENTKEEDSKKPLKTILRKKIKGNKIMYSNDSEEQDSSFVIQPDAPIELLECEPILPIMHDDEEIIEHGLIDEKCDEVESKEKSPCIDRHGWKCYPVNDNDTKLYEHTYILLEKLPESFVETYFRYQGVADKDHNDADIDRLTNLQSLHRTFSKENKARSKSSRLLSNGHSKSKDTKSTSRLISPGNDHCNELTPSEDEGANVDDEIAPATSQNTIENVIAKNSLMNDVESDSEKPSKPDVEVSMSKPIKKEFEEPSIKKYRPGPKSKKNIQENDSTFLTADKMMNKELTLLHAPVTLDAEDVKVKDILKKPSLKNVNKPSMRLRSHLERIKLKEESSSEEEKQWVTTKEKLLKRLGKRQGNSSLDDAKRAKLVSEFIEKRGDSHDKRPIIRTRKRRSRKKFLERKKQMSVLNRELFGELDTSHAAKKHSQAFGKGRRNIRKVIDKKSLARSTVIANMEEFERKRRLNMQQTRLREELGCEEGVNVLVINDEVCLEYDFEQMRPVVTIHPFFTRVMKAHQYEGVKFMWDACFESLAMVASGHAGGGCILAHCMGLGKTLQVLALLHTVLTHPGVGMKRVLVCCPLSTVLNWVDEINKWIGPVTNQIKVFELSKLKKTYERAYQLEDWYKDGGIFIIGYELFRSLTTLDPVLDEIKPKIIDKIRHALLNPGPDVVICDEGHLLKNDASVLAVAMSRVATRRRIVLTGTPMQNNLREYYCMVNFVKPSLLGTYAEYSNRFENPIMNGQHRDSHEEDIKLMKARTHILHKVLEGCLQRQEASVLYPYLPKKHEYTVFIPPTKCQWDLYKHYMLTYALEQQQQNKQQKQSLLKDFHVLQKIWTHPQVLHNFLMKARDERNKIKEEKLEDDLAQEDLAASEDVKPNQTEVWWLQYLAGGDMLESLESSNKFVVVFQLLDEFITLGDKVLIFSTSLYTMDALEYFLKRINKWSLGQEYFRLDGSVPAEVRQKWCREFNAPNNVNTKLFLISTRAGCLGLNMTAANRVIILDTSWNPAHDIQSIFRVYRFGQKKDCYIYRLVAMGTMEQKIYERSVTKQAVSCRVVDEQQIDRHYNMAELTELYRFDEEGATVEAGLAAGVSDVALLRVAARARLHAVREHDSLLRGSREQHLPEHERNAAWMQFQQEHANNGTEMQDRLMEASQGIQLILEANYAQPSGSLPIKMEAEQPPKTLLQPGPKVKKNRKKAATNSTPLLEKSYINDHKDVQLDPEKEEAKVKKIMQLLIKHNFHTSQRAHEITKLVASVRSIVDAGGTGLEFCDELTRSIATVMLQEDLSLGPPPLTDIITGDIITSPNSTEVKLEIPHETRNEILNEADEIREKIPEQITNRLPYQTTVVNNSDEGSLLVPVIETGKRLRGRPRKYFEEEIFEPIRSNRRLRKNTIDNEQSSIEDETNTSLQLRTNRGTSVSVGKKSKRLMGKPRRSYTSDLDSSASNYYSSKEQSPDIDNRSVSIPASKQKKDDTNMILTLESDVTCIDDEDNRSNSEPSVLRDVREETIEPEIKRPRRAIAVKSTAKVNRVETILNGKRKRKAAMVAEKHLEKLDTDDIITLDNDDEWVDDSEYYRRNRSANKLNTTTRGLDTQKKEKSKNIPAGEMKSTPRPVTIDTYVSSKNQSESSILLSDDEDRTMTNEQISQKVVPANSSDTETEETVPLHPSMLSNANFIKIVAYAYQSNRMLDEDAALLAAHYSTQKALKEYESTGKGITSGPLYDIAVKFLTKDVLKKLYNRKGSKRNETSLNTINNTDSTSSKQNTSMEDTALEVTITGEDSNSKLNYEPISSTSTSQPNVVPVGMFRGSAMNQKSHEVVEECILPDDDVCILGTTNETLPIPQNIYKKPNSQQFIITSVKSTTGGRRESLSVSTTESIVPEIKNPLLVAALQSQNKKFTTPAPVKPFVTLTERPKIVIGPNTPTYRLSKSNLKIEPTTAEAEQLNMTSGTQFKPGLTLTISEGKLVQPNIGVLNLNPSNLNPNSKKISSVAKPSSDTICLDSDEEDSATANKIDNVVHLPAPLKPVATSHASIPTPVAVTTSMQSFSVINNIHGVPVKMRLHNVQPQANAISAETHTNASQSDKNQQQNSLLLPASNLYDTSNKQQNIISSKKSIKGSTPKLPKLLPKPSPVAVDSAKRDVPQQNPKTIIRPEDILNAARPEKQIKKTCKAGDIVRITKEGSLAVLSRVEKLPDKLKSQLLNVPANSSEETKFQQPVDKRKSVTSGTSVQSSSAGKDPLSILKDVIHIQADEHDVSTSQTQPKTANKSFNHVDTKKQPVPSNSQRAETGGKITLHYPTKTHPSNSLKVPLAKKTIIEPVISSKKKEKESMDKKLSSKSASGTIDLTNILINNKPIAAVHKPMEKSTSKGSVIVGSSKDIIIRTKPIGSTLTKASTSATSINTKPATIQRENTLYGNDNKKRASQWPEPNSPKKKKSGLLRPTQTLEDFNIDDIDDIIELE